ncbi:hypothetical protein [Poriferisphaera corsica]|nr:hypothetical protein [Poriferisphaera corsica]
MINSITLPVAMTFIGQQTADPTRDHVFKEMANRYSIGVFWIVILGVLGVVSIVCLTFLWHRYRKRMNRLEQKINERRESTSPLASAWESAADRMDDKKVMAEFGETDAPPPQGAEIDDALEAEYDESDWDQPDWDPDNEDKGNLDDDPKDGPRYW